MKEQKGVTKTSKIKLKGTKLYCFDVLVWLGIEPNVYIHVYLLVSYSGYSPYESSQTACNVQKYEILAATINFYFVT